MLVCVHVSLCIYFHAYMCEHVCLPLCGGVCACVEEKLLPEQFIHEGLVSTATQQ